jgi:hypothetical protein
MIQSESDLSRIFKETTLNYLNFLAMNCTLRECTGIYTEKCFKLV